MSTYQAGTLPASTSGWLARSVRKSILRRLESIHTGEIVIVDGADTFRFGRFSSQFPLRATVRVHSCDFYTKVALEGSIGAGEAYAAGAWSCDDLTALVRIFLRNRSVMDNMEGGLARLSVPFIKLLHRLNKNTRSGSRRNIAAHYDLGNEFFELFLDPTMMYSAGIFESEVATLEEASTAKNDRLCRKLSLGPKDHVVEIGTGWGGFAVHAAKKYGCRVTTTTISREQYEYALGRVRSEDLEDRVTVLLEDYRDLKGRYTKLVSIEMIEAVGWQYYREFFEVCGRLLEDDGAAAIQAITIQDQHYDAARKTVDFIQRHIFPGSCIPSITALTQAATHSSDLKLFHFEDFAPHYARTLSLWRERFLDNAAQVRALGFHEEFIRLWDFYFSYCKAGFLERNIGSTQLVFTKPNNRLEPILGYIRKGIA